MSTIAERIIYVVEANGGNKSEFARALNLTPAYISKLGKNRDLVPSDRTIEDICREFNVNETWLRTGEGEMFVQLSRDEQIAKFVGDVMRSSDGDFKRSVILALSEMPDECWDVWADFVRKVAEKQKEKPPDE